MAQDGTFVGEIAPEMAEVAALADELRASVKLPKLSLDVFDYAFKPGEAVIDVVPGKAITGMVRPKNTEGLRRIMLIERHGRGVSLQAEGARTGESVLAGPGFLSASISVAAGCVASPSQAVPSPRRSVTTRTTYAWWATMPPI